MAFSATPYVSELAAATGVNQHAVSLIVRQIERRNIQLAVSGQPVTIPGLGTLKARYSPHPAETHGKAIATTSLRKPVREAIRALAGAPRAKLGCQRWEHAATNLKR